MEKRKFSRNPALDIIRLFALFCVVSIHFFHYTNYYSLTIAGGRMYIATLMRTFFRICVPLFLLLSGYLMRRKKASKDYYKKLIRIVGEYILASICCMIWRASRTGDQFADILGAFLRQGLGILSYESAIYSWYVEMYIGLFLLIPYLNILYDSLGEKRKKQNLIFTMLLLTSIPEVVNSIRFALPWEMTYNDPTEYLSVLPDWWNGIFPITYYLIGAYLSEYPLNLSKRKTVALAFLVFLGAGTFNYLQSWGTAYTEGPWQTNQSLFTVLQAVLVFHFFLRLDCSRIPGQIQKLLAGLSDLCFAAYLVSSIFDEWFYPASGWYGLPVYKLEGYFVLVPLVMCCSLALAFVVVSLYRGMAYLAERVRR